jgi:hypothetical protein
VIQGKSLPDGLSDIQRGKKILNIICCMDNHDEQRLASPEFVVPEKENL